MAYQVLHEQLLKAAAKTVASAIITSKHHRLKRTITFARAEETHTPETKYAIGLLASAADWQLKADLGKQLRFPEHVIQTTLHPGMLIFSNATKQMIMLELTVP